MRVFSATLRLAEIEGGSAHARFTTLNPGDLIERVVDAYRPDIEGAGGTLIVTATKEVIIDGDADLLAQALANLLDNAVSYAPSGGTIIVSLHTDRSGAVLGVQDRGPGVPVADRHRVLEPFCSAGSQPRHIRRRLRAKHRSRDRAPAWRRA
jgi:signal transduction histidine kinase